MLTSIILATAMLPFAQPDFSIIPRPVEMQAREGVFVIRSSTKIFAEPGLEDEAAYLSEKLGGMRVVKASSPDAVAGSILLKFQGIGRPDSAEGYSLNVTNQSVTLAAPSKSGVFHGIQSILQLFPLQMVENWVIPAVYIRDYPRFEWRGMHLDVGRHMFPVEDIKRYIDTLAFFKMNTFHWHLTEDQGWRVEVKKYPKLAEISAFRDETIGRPGTNKIGDGIRYGGSYTQAEMREVVEYARLRHVTVVPEIEMPGHSNEVLAAYPDLACDTPANVASRARGENPFKVNMNWGVKPDIFCAGKEETFEFIEDVFEEMLDIFPSKFIHIGGDEAPKTRWNSCARCKERMEKEGLKDAHELQSYFIQRIDKYLTSKGRRLIGWDEILEGGLAENATVMSWRGINGGIAAAKSGHDAVMSPTSHCYLDFYQSRLPGEPEAIGGFIDLARAYSYEPVPDALNAEEAKHILGVQGNVWTEYIEDALQVEYMAWPRGVALAEVGWTQASLKNFDDFAARWESVQPMLAARGVNFFKSRELIHKMPASIETTMGTRGEKYPVCAFDGDVNSQFESENPVVAGDTFIVNLVTPKTVRKISILFDPLRNSLRAGVVEVSEDGVNWQTVILGKGSFMEITSGPRVVKAIRLRITEDSKYRLIIREISID